MTTKNIVADTAAEAKAAFTDDHPQATTVTVVGYTPAHGAIPAHYKVTDEP